MRDLKAVDKIQKSRMRNEIKYWCTKEQYLNQILYNLHLENACQWRQLWNMIYLNIETEIEQKMKTKYDTINNKIKKLKNSEINNHDNKVSQHTFFKRTENMTDIIFTEEVQLLNKDLKYNIHSKPKTWIKTLAQEADTAIRTLPKENQAYMRQLVANNIKKLAGRQNQKRNKITQNGT